MDYIRAIGFVRHEINRHGYDPGNVTVMVHPDIVLWMKAVLQHDNTDVIVNGHTSLSEEEIVVIGIKVREQSTHYMKEITE